jgi:hypothetical protein
MLGVIYEPFIQSVVMLSVVMLSVVVLSVTCAWIGVIYPL